MRPFLLTILLVTVPIVVAAPAKDATFSRIIGGGQAEVGEFPYYGKS